MEATTPEERFTRIENLLETLSEHHLRHDAAIRDLIAASRTTLTAIDELREGQKELQETCRNLQEAQEATEDKLHILIETVDRIIRNRK